MDRKSFDKEYLKLKPYLEAYLYRLLTNKEDVADFYNNIYIKAEKNLYTFNGEVSSFKSWVFTIATRLVLNHLKREKKWDKNAQDTCRNALINNEEARTKFLSGIDLIETKYDIKEHIDFCFTCLNKTLTIEQQVAFLLKDIYDFKVSEICDIMKLSLGKVKHLLANSRKTLIHLFDERCAITSKNGICHQCSELQGLFNPKLDAHLEVNKVKKHMQINNKDDQERLLELRKHLVKNINPFQKEKDSLHDYLMSHLKKINNLS